MPRRTRFALVTPLLVLGAMLVLATAGPGIAQAALSATDLDHGVTPNDLATTLAGSGVTVSNVTYTGATRAAGTFAGGSPSIGFDSGIVLDSGKVQTVSGDDPCSRGIEGPNTCYE